MSGKKSSTPSRELSAEEVERRRLEAVMHVADDRAGNAAVADELSQLRREKWRRALRGDWRSALGLSGPGRDLKELTRMRRAEDEILAESRRVFEGKCAAFRADCTGADIEQYYAQRLEKAAAPGQALWQGSRRVSAEEGLRRQLAGLPAGMTPI